MRRRAVLEDFTSLFHISGSHLGGKAFIAKFVEFPIERFTIQAEQFRGARLISACLAKHFENVIALNFPQRQIALTRAGNEGRARAVISNALRQFIRRESGPGSERDSPLDSVFQFANVPRPGIGRQDRQGLGEDIERVTARDVKDLGERLLDGPLSLVALGPKSPEVRLPEGVRV